MWRGGFRLHISVALAKIKLTEVSWFPTANRKPRRGAERSGWRSEAPFGCDRLVRARAPPRRMLELLDNDGSNGG